MSDAFRTRWAEDRLSLEIECRRMELGDETVTASTSSNYAQVILIESDLLEFIVIIVNE